MGGRRAKKTVKPGERLDALEARLESLTAELADVRHGMEALGSLTQREGSWDTRTFARFLDVSSRTLERMMREGRVPHHRVGGVVRFTPADREAYLKQTEVVPEGEKA